MSTDSSNIETLAGIAGELTDVIKTNSIAYQVCGVQHSTSRAPLVFGIKKGGEDVSFEIVKKVPEGKTLVKSSSDKAADGFSEEMIDDVYAIFGKDATDILKTIAANNLADNLDIVIVDHMYDISKKGSAVTYNFSTGIHKDLIAELVLKINQERMIMAKGLKRGLPKILIVSPGVAALLITNKMVAGNDSDYIAGDKENTKFVGKMGDMMVYMMDQSDLTVATEYVMIAHKLFLPGDASMMLIPMHAPKANFRRDSETGQMTLHYTHKYAYSRNPLDSSGTSTTVADTIFLNSDNSLNSISTDLSTLFSPGFEITISTTTSNNGDFVVDTVTTDKVVFTGSAVVDEGVGTTISPTDAIFTASDNSINSVLTDLSATFSPGDTFDVEDTASNNGTNLVVDTVTANKIVVTAASGTIVDEGTGSADLILNNSVSSVLLQTNSDFITSFVPTLTGFTV